MKTNFDEAEGGSNFEQNKRYTLFIDSAKEVYGNTKGTPGIELKLSADVNGEMVDAYKHTIWLSPKALFRAQTWYKAMGLKHEGEVDVDVKTLAGIRLSAKCVYEKKQDDDGKEHTYTKWEDPERIAIGSAAPQPEQAEAAAPDVPF